MPVFGGRSESELKYAHPDLVRVMRRAITVFDFMVLQSTRSPEEQEADFLKGTTKAHWKESPHDYLPSYALDCAPYPLDWSNKTAFRYMASAILGFAKIEKVDVTWGGNFTSIKDLPHFELTDWRELRNVATS